MTREEVEMAAREHGIADVSELSAAILEPDGSISVIAKKGTVHRARRRGVRHLRRP